MSTVVVTIETILLLWRGGFPTPAPSELKQSGSRGGSLAWFFTHYMCTALRNNKFAYMVATMGLLPTTRGGVLAVSFGPYQGRRKTFRGGAAKSKR